MIPGVTTKSRLPRVGKIRLGEKGKTANGKEYPKAIDHFRFDDAPGVESIYGANCTEIFPVLFPHDEEDIWFPTSRSAYSKSGLFCRCSDGETATRVFNAGDKHGSDYLASIGETVDPGDMFELPCAGEDCPYFENKQCKNVGRLFLVLPRVPMFGVYEITTSSFNSIVNVLNMARQVKALAGCLAGIPFALVLKPMQVQPDGKAKTVHVLDLEFRGSYETLAAMSKKMRLSGGNPLALIDAGDSVPDDLYAHGGASLDEALGGPKVQTGSLKERIAARPVNGGAIAPPDDSPAQREPVQQQRPPQQQRSTAGVGVAGEQAQQLFRGPGDRRAKESAAERKAPVGDFDNDGGGAYPWDDDPPQSPGAATGPPAAAAPAATPAQTGARPSRFRK